MGEAAALAWAGLDEWPMLCMLWCKAPQHGPGSVTPSGPCLCVGIPCALLQQPWHFSPCTSFLPASRLHVHTRLCTPALSSHVPALAAHYYSSWLCRTCRCNTRPQQCVPAWLPPCCYAHMQHSPKEAGIPSVVVFPLGLAQHPLHVCHKRWLPLPQALQPASPCTCVFAVAAVVS